MLEALVSVIIPIYKVEDYLDRCINSIVNQTYTNLEIILVDDGSPDGCPKLCDKWVLKDSRIKVVHKVNGGLSDARNAGLKIATGEYITFVDSDDWLDIHFIEYLYNTLVSTKSDIVECNRYITSTIENIICNDKIENTNTYDTVNALKLLIEDTILHQTVWNKLYTRDVIKGVFFEKGKTNEDEYWTYQVFGNANKVTKINNYLYFYYQRPNSIMTSNYSIKRLDAIEAKYRRQIYIDKMYPTLSVFARNNLFGSIIYQAQMSLLYLNEKDKNVAVDQLNEYLSKFNYSIKDCQSIKGTNRLWYSLACISFWNTVKLKNKLKKGL